MGQHSVSLNGLGPDPLHTFHCSPCLPGSCLLCGQGKWKVISGPSMPLYDRSPPRMTHNGSWGGGGGRKVFVTASFVGKNAM